MQNSERGSVFLRVLIVVLSVAIILSVLIPQFRQKREKEETALCREQMSAITQAQAESRKIKRIYADNLDSLAVFLPEEMEFTCPTDARSYLITAVDSSSYSISCPNDHGMVRNGGKSWEQK
jgi:hypothetical protein